MNANPESEDFSDLDVSDDSVIETPARARRSFSARLLRALLRAIGDPPVEFVLWTGERVAARGAPIVSRVLIRSRATLFGLLRDPFVRFGDAYSTGQIEVQGDLVQTMSLISRSGQSREANPTL